MKKPESFGELPKRYVFALNANTEYRASRCPQCGEATLLRKFPLLIHIEPKELVALRKSCRFCPRCELIVAQQDDLEALLADLLSQRNPALIGNRYFVIGTVEQQAWRKCLRAPKPIAEMRQHVADFTAHGTIRRRFGGWTPADASPNDEIHGPEQEGRMATRKKSNHSAGMSWNAPCPCGSGKKYKKCCLGRKPARPAGMQAEGASPGHSASVPRETHGPVPPGHSPLQIHPYAIAKIVEGKLLWERCPDLREHMERHWAEGWTIRKIASMTTPKIEAQLHACGVKHSRERFLSLAAQTWSAWTVAERWQESDPVRLKDKDSDFLGLAACELWKRFLPEHPSMEMLDDWMQEGYQMLEDSRRIDACERWWNVWRTLQPRFSPEMQRMDDTATLFDGLQSLYNWAQDFETELGTAAASDPQLALRGIQYCTEWLAQFTGEEELLQCNFRRGLAWFYFRAGEANKGRQLLESTIERWPQSVWGYFALSDAYSHFLGPTPLAKDLDKAISLLEQGISRAKAEIADLEIIEERLADLRKEKSGSL